MQILPEYLAAFHRFIQERVSLTNAEWQCTVSMLDFLTLPAQTPLLREGQICTSLYFLHQGLVRFFVIDADGKDTTKFFTLQHQLFTSQQSFSTQSPAREQIETLEDSSFLVLSHAALQHLYQEIPKWNVFIRRVLQDVNTMTERIYMESITTTAEQRYRSILSNEPELALRAPLKHIASYLGITPESLSRIRKKIAAEL